MLGSFSQQDRNDVLACHLVCSMLGQTVLARCLKTDTLKRHSRAAADWSVTNDPVLADPTAAAAGKNAIASKNSQKSKRDGRMLLTEKNQSQTTWFEICIN